MVTFTKSVSLMLLSPTCFWQNHENTGTNNQEPELTPHSLCLAKIQVVLKCTHHTDQFLIDAASMKIQYLCGSTQSSLTLSMRENLYNLTTGIMLTGASFAHIKVYQDSQATLSQLYLLASHVIYLSQLNTYLARNKGPFPSKLIQRKGNSIVFTTYGIEKSSKRTHMEYCASKNKKQYHSWKVIGTIKSPGPLLVFVNLLHLFLSKPTYREPNELKIIFI